MSKLLPGGFPELTPNQQIIENYIKDIITKEYKNFGFVNIETPAIEFNDVLNAKGGNEVNKQIYGLYGLKQGGDDLKNFSLHFDLTVPLARYIIDNENNISFPFKRYQMQKVWRGETQQKGRFKEFTQCDIDVIGNNLSMNYDIEVIEVLFNTIQKIFNFLQINKGIEVHINNRKFIDGICDHFQIQGDNKIFFYNLLDKFYKMPREQFNKLLKQITGNSFEEVNGILKGDIHKLSLSDTAMSNGFSELIETYQQLKKKGVNVIFNPYITRGLDYYTGTVFETFISDYFNFGSVCSGGRFDNLVGDIRKISNHNGINYGGVGGSIGLSRLFSRLSEGGFLNKKIPLTDTIIFNIPGNNQEYREKIGGILRSNEISTDIYYEDHKLGKQFNYASNKNIPFGIFAGPEEESLNQVKIKNLDNRNNITIELEKLKNYIITELKNI